jgi:hypothetical protein|tara:strand:+ start:2047 stop:2337 length:291 start_codon:yes stop_codon:yes gene_type:complete
MTNKRGTYRVTTYEDAENLTNAKHEDVNGDIYAVLPILDLEKRLAKWKKSNNQRYEQKRAAKTDCVIIYFRRLAHLQGDEPDDKDILIGDILISGE